MRGTRHAVLMLCLNSSGVQYLVSKSNREEFQPLNSDLRVLSVENGLAFRQTNINWGFV